MTAPGPVSTVPPLDSPVPGPVVDVEVPLHVASLGNRREDWRARQRRVRREWAAVGAALAGRTLPGLPVTVTITRIDWSPLDADGLVSAMKAIVDCIAWHVGDDDRDPGYHWRLTQQTSRAREWVRDRRHNLVQRVAARLHVRVAPWQPSDGGSPLVVLPPGVGGGPAHAMLLGILRHG
jgi:hypothetical protein